MENKRISALECLRDNRKITRDEILTQYGSDGIYIFDLFQARYSQVRKQKDGTKTSVKREEVIDVMMKEVLSGKHKNPYKRQKMITNILIVVGAIIGTILLFVFGGTVLLFVPPIWIIVIIILWILKKI